MSLSRDDWTSIRDAWNQHYEAEAAGRTKPRTFPYPFEPTPALLRNANGDPVVIADDASTLHDLIRREAARILYLLLHLDDSEALRVAEMSEEAFVAFCLEQLP